MAHKNRWTIAVDFDGVIHSYTSGWQGAHVVPDPPVEGAIEWLHTMIQRFDVAICSTRCRRWRGRRAVRRWLQHWTGNLWHDYPGGRGLEDVQITAGKPPALIYLDDRAVRFEGPGTFPSREKIHQLRPWWKPLGEEKTDGE